MARNKDKLKDFSRRDFVKTAGAVGAVAAAIPTVQAAPAIRKVRAANDPVQFGMIGTGSRGSYLLKHLKNIELQQQPQLVSEVPALLPLAVHDAHDPDLGRLDALAGRGQAVEAHRMGSHELELHPDLLTFREESVDSIAPVGESAGDVELGEAFRHAVVAQVLETEAPLAVVGRAVGARRRGYLGARYHYLDAVFHRDWRL